MQFIYQSSEISALKTYTYMCIELNRHMYWHIMVHTARKHDIIIITISSGHRSNDKITSTEVIISIFYRLLST